MYCNNHSNEIILTSDNGIQWNTSRIHKVNVIEIEKIHQVTIENQNKSFSQRQLQLVNKYMNKVIKIRNLDDEVLIRRIHMIRRTNKYPNKIYLNLSIDDENDDLLVINENNEDNYFIDNYGNRYENVSFQ